MRRLALAVLLVSSGAAARTVTKRGDIGPDLQVLVVRGELNGTIARFRVSYAVMIDEAGYGSTIDNLELPGTALVTAATVRRDGTARRLDLVRALDASTKWGELVAEEDEAG